MNNKVGVLLIKFTPLCLLYISITSGHPIHIHSNGCSTLTCGCSQQQDTDGQRKRKSICLSRYKQYVEDLRRNYMILSSKIYNKDSCLKVLHYATEALLLFHIVILAMRNIAVKHAEKTSLLDFQ